MINKNTILYSIGIITLLLISELLFNPSNLYFELRWLDIFMHIMGGLLFAGLFYNVFYNNKYIDQNKLFIYIIISVLIIGIFWEISECIRDIFSHNLWGGVADTIKDIINDTIGALIYIYNKVDNRKE